MPNPGAVLGGKYRLVRKLGAGGMGVVYEADHIRLRQPFAVKILQPELAQEREFLLRFEREARAAALLRSPHIVRVFDVDVSAEGLTYMVMELLDGRDLAEESLAAPIPVTQLVDWLVQICSALGEAHDNGIIHRDLKPANIFITGIESGERIAKVLDFGISKLEASSRITCRASGALGTPTYMAPEQIRGRHVDSRTDIWALGVMLYRLLARQWPFGGKGQSDSAYLAAVLSDPAVPIEHVRPDLPAALSAAIMKALEKDPACRHASAAEMASALLPFGSGRGPLQSRVSLPVSSALVVGGAGPRAIVRPEAETARHDVGEMDTVVEAPPPRVATTIAATAISKKLPYSGRSRFVTAAASIAAVCAFAALGAFAYLLVTSRSTRPAPVSAAAAASETASASSEPSPVSSAVEARPATTGVPSSSSIPPRKRPRRPPPRSSAPGAVLEPNDSIPDHL